MTRRKHDADMAACHAEGLTVPETADRLGICQTTIYRWAQMQGMRFANRKKPPPPLTQESEARRRAAQQAAFQRHRATPVNGWTWAALMEAGFTAPEAAKLRGQTIAAAYQAERAMGRKFYRLHLRDLTDKERRKMYRIRRDYGVSRDMALEIMSRPDLIEPRPSGRVRRRAKVKADPEAALIEMMRASA